jgi:short-subunit dehydrogenase
VNIHSSSEVEMNQIVLVTGATSGIGRATALELAQRGHHVIACGRREAELVALTEAARPGRIDGVPLDVCDPASVAAAAAAVEALTAGHGVDVLINNAGYGQVGAVLDVTDEAVHAQLETNVHGLLRVTRAFVPAMIRRGAGRVINVSSVGGKVTFPMAGVYHASKYAVEALSDALRMELAPLGVHVSVIEPGAVRTEFGDVAVASLERAMPASSPWRGAKELSERAMALYEQHAPGPAAVVAAMVHATESARPRPRYVAPFYNLVTLTLAALLPTRWLDAALRRVWGLNPRQLGVSSLAAPVGGAA